jgi:hypothetical protein
MNDLLDRADMTLIELVVDSLRVNWVVLIGVGGAFRRPGTTDSLSVSKSVSSSVSVKSRLRLLAPVCPGTFLKLSTDTLELEIVAVVASIETVVTEVIMVWFC